jgi:hypothetical protein
MKVLMLSKACMVGAYQKKLEEMADTLLLLFLFSIK